MKLTNNKLEQLIMEELSLLTEMKELSDITFPIPKDALKDNAGRKQYLGSNKAFSAKKWKNASKEGEIDKAKFVEIIKSFRTDQQNQMKKHPTAKTWAALLDPDTARAFIGADTATEPASDTTTEPASDTTTEPASDTATEPASDTAIDSRATYEWKGVEFKFKDEQFGGEPLSKDNYQKKFADMKATLVVARQLGNAPPDGYRFIYQGIIDPAYLDDFLAEINKDSNTKIGRNGKKIRLPAMPADITEKEPAVYNKDRFVALIQNVIDKAQGTDQAAVKTAKDALIAYYKQYTQAADKDANSDNTLKTAYNNAINAKAQFSFDELDTLINNLNTSTDKTSIDTNKKALEDYFNINKTEIIGNSAKKQVYDKALSDATSRLTTIRLDSYKNKISNANNLASTVGSTQASLQTALNDLNNSYTSDANFKAFVDADRTDYDKAKNSLTKAIDLIVNKWKQDPFGETELDASTKFKNPGPTGDELRKSIYQNLVNAFGGVTAAEIQQIAGLKESLIREDVNKFEIDDIEALFDLKPQFDSKGKIKSSLPKGQSMTSGHASKTELDLAKKVKDAINKYINSYAKTSPGDTQGLKKLIAAKRKYTELTARTKKVKLATKNKFIQIDAVSPAEINQLNARATALGIEKVPMDARTLKTFNDFFENYHTIQERIKKLENISKKINSGNYSPSDDAGDLYSGAALLNMLSLLSRTTDGSAGGLIMEAFLAALAGGEKTGGSMGAGDFSGDDGLNYSSKFGTPAYQMSQAAKHFTIKGNPGLVTYVCSHRVGPDDAALKTAGVPKKPAKGQPASTMEGIALKIGIFTVETTTAFSAQTKAGSGQFKLYSGQGTGGKLLKWGDNKTSNGIYSNANTSTDSHPGVIEKDGKYRFSFGSVSEMITKLDKNDTYDLTFVDVADINTSFDDKFSDAVDKSTNTVLITAKELNDTVANIKNGSVDFLREKDMGSALTMAENYRDLKSKIKALYNAVFATTEFENESDKYIGALQESKLQTLDNLIAEVMKDIKKVKKIT